MFIFQPNQPHPLPHLAPIREALQEALNDADETDRPGLQRALGILDRFLSSDGPATEDWAKRTLAVAGIDPSKKEVKAIQALRSARPDLGLKEATNIVRSLKSDN
ncbi:hypothetical protein [Streptomyces sp. IBSBF 2806]|uniref:hypothetical protein n=1 Tax=Streptomyces sp. IBSBF 2806 TaxID=2903529 RepID=UPI002FDBEE05